METQINAQRMGCQTALGGKRHKLQELICCFFKFRARYDHAILIANVAVEHHRDPRVVVRGDVTAQVE